VNVQYGLLFQTEQYIWTTFWLYREYKIDSKAWCDRFSLSNHDFIFGKAGFKRTHVIVVVGRHVVVVVVVVVVNIHVHVDREVLRVAAFETRVLCQLKHDQLKGENMLQ